MTGRGVMVDTSKLPAIGSLRWDEPAQANSPRGWLWRTMSDGELCLGFYLDYGPDHYRSAHDSWCTARQPCRECQPGNVLACAYAPGQPEASRYFVTVAEARAYVDAGGQPAPEH